MKNPTIAAHIGLAEERLREAHGVTINDRAAALARMAAVHVDLARLLLDRDRYAAEYEKRGEITPDDERRRREMTAPAPDDTPRRRS